MSGDAQALGGLRVGIASVSLSRGGAERQAALWADVAVRQGAAVRMLALEPASETYRLPPQATVEVVGKSRRRDTLRAVARLRRWARGCHAVVAFQPYIGALCMLGRVDPCLLVAGEDPRRWRDTSRAPPALYRRAFRHATTAAAPSAGLVACHRALRLEPRGRWLQLANIVSDDAFAGLGAVDSPRSGALFVGRLVPEKDPLLALRAGVAAGMPITFLGGGPLRGELLAEARRLRAESLVRLEGFVAAPWRHFARHRVVVVTSRYETFANVIVESLAAGTPVVSVDCDFGPREILAGLRESRLVARTPDAIAAALADVASRPSTAEERAACRRAAEPYRAAALAPAIAAALRETAARR
jgi:glycosyltransferase involved in cell wall biosynthesis